MQFQIENEVGTTTVLKAEMKMMMMQLRRSTAQNNQIKCQDPNSAKNPIIILSTPPQLPIPFVTAHTHTTPPIGPMPRPLQILQIYRILRSASQAGRLNPKEFVPGEVVKTQLDPTKLAASPLRRLPIFDIKQPIQGRPRESNSNAFKEFRNREERRMQKALDSLTHGKHIFVYQHARTKQVIYSLTRHLEVRFLPLIFLFFR